MQVNRWLYVLLALVWMAGNETTLAQPHFVNPIAEGADPWVIHHGDHYYWCQSEGNRGVAVYRSDRLTELGEKFVVWQAPRSGPHSKEIWAPEMHHLDGKWYIYVAASDGHNRNHRMICLEGKDPTGPFTFKAQLYTGDHHKTGQDNRWAIDGTVLEHGGKRFFIWSGWKDEKDEQFLYIAMMKNPWTLAQDRILLCPNNDYLWERVTESLDERGLHEAPQVWNHEGRTFLIYSCSGSWQPTYKWGLLTLENTGDPLNPDDWRKHPRPAFQSTETTYGVGHGNMTVSPDGQEYWITYHAKQDRNPGWRRSIFVQPFQWTENGLPEFGHPAERGKPLPFPSGSRPVDNKHGPIKESFDQGSIDWNFYGHHQLYAIEQGRLHLGKNPTSPINLYRSGEKALIRGGQWTNFIASVTIRVEEGERDAGLLFRATQPAVGYDAVEGYFAGIIPGADRVILGYMNGAEWKELARASRPLEQTQDYRLTIKAQESQISLYVDEKPVLEVANSRATHGTIGLRVVDVHASFEDLIVTATP